MKDEKDFIQQLLSPKHKEKAFVRLVDLYQERLYWHIRKLVVSHENANDVLQNTFVRVYKSLFSFKQQSSLHTWMYRIAYNESLRLLEKNKNRNAISLEDVQEKHLESLFDSDYLDGSEIQIKLKKALSMLSEKQRIVFQMKYYDDLKFREISDILDIKENSVKTCYYGAVKHIEKKMLEVEIIR
ncbi:RNA polymerase sigma factor [Wenyingzhuangia sp. 2_MG-2023]|uniref:RNA polymerase sigma factor n=1 Tax=Wenyingzhuangia sp. 2_MG-2023 TaxID=3062639 RepID=UPI0026E1324D|nr:RNA polymerase sigma factor [Wenyingzhuangia sp. 2_MG-2023]MDO6738638.1 RNA polymerase sigma factor [Wenyingzhuangia sp. 2_MG-2023]